MIFAINLERDKSPNGPKIPTSLNCEISRTSATRGTFSIGRLFNNCFATETAVKFQNCPFQNCLDLIIAPQGNLHF